MRFSLWALLGAFLVEVAWWVMCRDRTTWTQARPSRCWQPGESTSLYWGDL
jgi:hypothetical protein